MSQWLDNTGTALGIVAVVSVVVLYALKEWMRGSFAPAEITKKVDLLATKAELTETADAIAEDLDGIGRKVERVEKFTFAMQDQIADNRGRSDTLSRDIKEVREYGSIPMRKVLEDQSKILLRLNLITHHLGLKVPDEDI